MLDKLALDVGLSFGVLRYVNSAFVGLHDRVSSIGQAVSLLGLARLEQWASLTVFTSSDDEPPALTTTALVRARFCELAGENHVAANGSELFTLGLLSVIDARFDTPIAELLSELPLAPTCAMRSSNTRDAKASCWRASARWRTATPRRPRESFRTRTSYVSALAGLDEVTEPLYAAR